MFRTWSNCRWLVFLLVMSLLVSGCGGKPATAVPPSAATAAPATPPPAQATGAPTTGADIELPASLTGDGLPLLGDPTAPVTLVEFSDYQCPFCARHSTQTWPALVDKYGRSGQVNFVFRDFPIVELHPNAPAASAAADCVAEQGPALFWSMHEQLFATQDDWASLEDPSAYFAGLAEGAGADATAYGQCIASGGSEPIVQAGIAAGKALGFSGTPSFQFVDNRGGGTYTLVGAQPLETFSAWLDAMVAGQAPPAEEQPEADAPQLPYWAADGLAPDPARPGFTLAGDEYRGDPTAKLVVVEFADFQCPPCRQHALEVQPTLDKVFVDSGQIMWVFKHMPLQIHPQAAAAAAAAECAAAQNKFWEMHDLLFSSVEQWSVAAPDSVLAGLAAQLGLDQAKFSACLASRQALEPVLADIYDAQSVVSSTPTFVVLYGGQGRLIAGSMPVDQFQETLQGMLEEATASPTVAPSPTAQ